MVVFFPIGIISTCIFNLHNFKVHANAPSDGFPAARRRASIALKTGSVATCTRTLRDAERARTHTIDWFHNVMTASRQEEGEKYRLPDQNPAIMTFPDRRGRGDGWRMERGGEEKRAGRMRTGKKKKKDEKG